MPIRIYALAKELKLDSKVLADICTKAGVTGKGSALASLTDEEAVLVKQYVAGGKKGAPVRPGAAGQSAPGVGTAAIRREDYMGPGGTVGKPPVLTGRPPEKPPLARHREAEEAAAPPAVAEPGPVETPPAPVDAPETPSVEAPPAPVAEADAPSAVETKHTSGAPAVPPLIRQGPVQDLSNRPQRPGMPSKFDKPPLLDRMKGKDRQRSEKSDRPERQGLAIKLAPMPAPPSRPITRASEPAPQKPDLRLPLDAIRASKSGEKPLSDHLKKAEQKRRTGGRKGAPPELPPLPDVVPEVLPGDRDRKRKTPAVEGGEDEMGSTLGGREHRQLKRKRTKPAQARVAGEEGETTVVAKRPQRIRRTGANTAAPRKSQQVLHLPCTVRAFSEALGMPARNVLGKLLALGVTTANINADLSGEMAELLAVELGVELEIRKHVNLEDQVISTLDQQPDDPANLEPRAPVVTFLGHVDHGSLARN